MQEPDVDAQWKECFNPEKSSPHKKAVVVGLYGLPGSGKTFLLNQLKQALGETHFAFYEGSEMIAAVVDGGLDSFQNMEEQEKKYWRGIAIKTIANHCAESGQLAVVAGHYMFWAEEQKTGVTVCTESDEEVYTHILYLDVNPEIIVNRRQSDSVRTRPTTSVDHLCKWQEEEKKQLHYLCRKKSILFSLVPSNYQQLQKCLTLLHDFKHHTEEYNLSEAKNMLDRNVVTEDGLQDTILVMDADRTLCAEDTGRLFWKMVSEKHPLDYGADTLKELFSSDLGHSYTAFRQAVLLYEEAFNDQEFDALCQNVASAVSMYPEVVSLLQVVSEQKHVGAVVVTCGLRRVWDKILEREGLSKNVNVIGGGRIADGFVVSAAVKEALVTRLQKRYRMRVWAFGDSPIDLGMLKKADQAIVVVGEESKRSKTMDALLAAEIDYNGLRAHQAVLPSSASPRLDTDKLPKINLISPGLLQSILRDRYTDGGLQALCATERNAAKLLATPMRNAAVAGASLRNAHRRVGRYLGIEYLTDVLGLEECPIQHVLGHPERGFQLFHERQTTIVALMRGGEPMASGVSDAFPLAMFLHAKDAGDIKLHHLEGQVTVMLVDSVINTGETIIRFVDHVRQLHATIRIVVVAGVVQGECVSESTLKNGLEGLGKIRLVALRLSSTKFKGSGRTDTGNRLFNTTHLA